MPTTPKFGFRYPAATDPPNSPTQMQQLATDVEAAITATYADYNSSADQSCPNGSTILAFGSAVRTSPLVTRAVSGVGHRFTLNRKGLWLISASVRVNGGGSSAYTGLNIVRDGGGNLAINAATTNGICILNPAAAEPMEAGESVSVTLYHERGSAVVSPSTVGNAVARIRLAWLGGL